MMRKAIWLGGAAVILASSTGCVHESTQGDTKVFSYELWVPLVILLGGIVAMPAGWFLRSLSERLGWALMIGGVVAVVIFTPTMFFERATVDQTGYSSVSGFMGTTAHSVKYADIGRVRIVVEVSTGRRGRKQSNLFLICELKNGTSEKLPVNNDVTKEAAPHFMTIIRERGITVQDESGL